MILVAACFRSETRGIRRTPDLRVVHTAMGDGAAAAVAQAASEHPALLVSTGFCGGLAADLRPGDLVLADEVRSDVGAMRVDADLVRRACEALAGWAGTVRVGPVACAADVVGPTAKRDLASCGAVAVDLESACLAKWARAHGVPFLSLRVVLDAADEDVPFSRRVPLWMSVLRHPILAARIARRARIAAARLGAAVGCLAEAWEATR